MAFVESHMGQRLVVTAYAVVATVIVAVFPGGPLAFAFGLPLLFFVPGFAVVRLFFWKGTAMETKFVLSLGLSILAVIFLGLFLVLTPIGLDQDTTRGSLVLFTVAAVALETFWLRADRVDEKAEKPAKAKEPAPKPVQAKPDKVVAAMIATALAVSAISLGLIITADYPSRTYFAITDENGLVITNTTRTPGTNITMVVHMKNGEDGPRTFMMVAYNESLYGPEWHNKSMAKNELWNVTIVFTLGEPGTYRIDFDLYIQEEGEEAYFYGNLHMWFQVVD